MPMTRGEFTALVSGVDGWLSAREGAALYACARACRGPGVIVEIGSWQGRSTIVLAAGARAGAGVPVHAVDPHQGLAVAGGEPSFAAFQANLARAGVAGLVQVHMQTSVAAAREFALPVDLVYVDGAHDAASVRADFAAWFPKVRDGGVMAFHDTVAYPGPRTVVRDCLYRSPAFRRIRLVGSLTYAQKTSRATRRERWANALRWRWHQGRTVAHLIAARLPFRARLGRLRRRLAAGLSGPPGPSHAA